MIDNSNMDAVERAYDKRMAKDFVEKMQGKVTELSSDALKARIVRFLEANCICHLATCVDDRPRSTVLRYRSRDLTIFVFNGVPFNLFSAKSRKDHQLLYL